MRETSDITQMLWSQFAALPLYLTWLAGVVVAIVTWKRHPAVSILASVAFVVLLALTFGSRIVNIWLPRLAMESGWTSDQIGLFYSIYGFVFATIEAVVWIAIIVAMFRWRTVTPTP